jgi:phosphomannomutase
MELFGTAGIRGDVVDIVTPELALEVGRAVGTIAGEAPAADDPFSSAAADSPPPGSDAAESPPDLDSQVVVGRDGRTSAPALEAAVVAGAAAAGATVRRAGVVPTPTLAFASRGRYGVMVTASHNPPTDNGLKLFVDGVEFDRERERQIEAGVETGQAPTQWAAWTTPTEIDPVPSYLDAVAAYARDYGGPIDGLQVVVDCGNGMAGLATPQVLGELGADVVTLNGAVDGHFPGRESKPTPDSTRDLQAFVADGPAAFGIAHDGDADRIVIVDGHGEIVHEDTVLAILAERYVRTSTVDDPVLVTTPNASARIDERVRDAGGRVERVRLGALHEGVAAARNDGGEVVFAAEPWKHLHPAFGGWIDGVVSAAVLTRLIADASLDSLRAPITERPYRKVSVPCPEEAKASAMDRLVDRLPATFPDSEVATEHGVRLAFPDASWVLVRPSGTEAYIRLYAESEDVEALVAEARGVIEEVVDSTDD